MTPTKALAETDWRTKKCPKCGRKGLHYAMHPHAYGHKDTSTVTCRFCHAYFKKVDAKDA